MHGDHWPLISETSETWKYPGFCIEGLKPDVEKSWANHSWRLLEVLSADGLHCWMTSPTHDRSGILNLVATRADLATPDVSVLGGRHLWPSAAALDLSPWVTTSRLPSTTRRRTVLGIMSMSTSSRLLFVSQRYPSTAADTDRAGDDDTDVDVLADQYISVITSIANWLALLKTVTCRRLASDPWFDDECCAARKFERWCSHLLSYREQWQSKLRSYRRLTRRKRAEFCHASVKEQSLSPRWLWHCIDHGPGDTGRVTRHLSLRFPQVLHWQNSWRASVDRCY